MTLEEKKDQIRALSQHINRICTEYVLDKGLLDTWKITDPQKHEQYFQLQDLLDHHMKLYLDDKIPWNNEVREEIEVIQCHPEDTPVSVRVKRYDFSPTVMQTARDILIFAVLP